jgi:MYXO-CTERM domain-containing protein
MRQIILCAALLLSAATSAQASATLNVGDHFLLPNTPGQSFDIFVTGNDLVLGTDINSQIADSGPLAAGSILAPTYTGDMLVPGAIFATNNTGIVDETSGLYGHEFLVLGTLTDPSTDGVIDNGLLVRLTFDTTGFTSGSWPLLFSGTVNGDTAFGSLLSDGTRIYTSLTITNGSITIVPEPSSVVLGLFAAAGLFAVAVRRRRNRYV